MSVHWQGHPRAHRHLPGKDGDAGKQKNKQNNLQPGIASRPQQKKAPASPSTIQPKSASASGSDSFSMTCSWKSDTSLANYLPASSGECAVSNKTGESQSKSVCLVSSALSNLKQGAHLLYRPHLILKVLCSFFWFPGIEVFNNTGWPRRKVTLIAPSPPDPIPGI